MVEFPIGEHVADTSPRNCPSHTPLAGKTVRLEQPDADRDAQALFTATHSNGVDPGQWTYMSYGPFAQASDMHDWIVDLQSSQDPLYLVVREPATSEPVGMVSFLNIAVDDHRLELGNIWYVPAVQRTCVNTETVYLMLCESFDRLRYRRVEWKCDSLNARSVTTAARLGFSFEGVFRQHFIAKGRNRDTAWFAMLDSDWPMIKKNFEAVLYDPQCTVSLATLNAEYLR